MKSPQCGITVQNIAGIKEISDSDSNDIPQGVTLIETLPLPTTPHLNILEPKKFLFI